MPNFIQRLFGIPDPPAPPPPEPELSPVEQITNSFTGYALRHPEQALTLYGLLNPTSPTHENALAVLRQALESSPEDANRILEQINPTAFSSSPTQEDWYWGRLATGGEEDYYWRRLSDNWYQKDVIPSTFLEIHNACYEAYNANPLAFAIVEITVAFVLGKGIKVVAHQKKVQKILDSFWNDPDNHMDSRVYDLCRELSIYGEDYIRFFVNPFDGSVKIRFIDPSIIDQVETDPDDIEKHLRYHRRPIGPSPTQTLDATSNTLDGVALTGKNPGDPTMQGEWFLAGEQVCQVAINKVSNAKRGKSDLATLLPWLRRYKDWLTDRVRINKYKGAFLWDVALKGADLKTIKAKKMEYSYPPEPGSVVIHNEAETWTPVNPGINSADAADDGRQIKLMVAVGALLPEHYLSDGSTATRATAAEMGLPTLLKFQMRQKVMKQALRIILNRVLEEAKKVGKLPGAFDPNTAYDLIFPEMDMADNQAVSQAVNYMVGALVSAKAQGWISDETAMKLMFKVLNEEIDVHQEMEKILTQLHIPPQAVNDPGLATTGAGLKKPAGISEAAMNPVGTGMMLCFYPPPGVAKKLAVKGGEPADELHITLAYLGDMQDNPYEGLRPHDDPEPLLTLLKVFAQQHAPLEALIGGIGRFISVPDGEKTPMYASVDAPGLAEFRTELVKLVTGAGYYVATDHDFSPHMTLDWLDADAPMPQISLPANPSLAMQLDTLYLVVGNKRYPFTLSGKE